MRKVGLCLFYGLCVFAIVFSLYWISLPQLRSPAPQEALPDPVSYTHLDVYKRQV